MGLHKPALKPKADSKRDRKARVAIAKKRMNTGSAGAPPMEYDDGVTKSTGGRGKVKASKSPGIRQRQMTGPVWNGVTTAEHVTSW